MAKKNKRKNKRKNYSPKYKSVRKSYIDGGRVSLAHGGQPTPPNPADYFDRDGEFDEARYC